MTTMRAIEIGIALVLLGAVAILAYDHFQTRGQMAALQQSLAAQEKIAADLEKQQTARDKQFADYKIAQEQRKQKTTNPADQLAYIREAMKLKPGEALLETETRDTSGTLVVPPAVTLPAQQLFLYSVDCETCKTEREVLQKNYEDEKRQRAAALKEVQDLKSAKLSFWSRHPKLVFWLGLSAGAAGGYAVSRR